MRKECLADFGRITVGEATVFHGSNLDVLPFMADNSVDSIVTDPPYELGFMGKKWDSTGIAYNVDLWRECLRVLKPGGHILSFGGSRTWHRMAVAIEDAGFELRDSIAWLYGSGFPKSHNLKGKWQGWGTALKPAFEPVVVARKPLVGTVAANVLEWGVGGLNIDGSRIGRADGDNSSAGNRTATFGTQETVSGGDGSGGWSQNDAGRWPANIILDEYTAELLDEQSGFSKSSGVINRFKSGAKPFGGAVGEAYESVQGVADSGGASRFFYVSKANKKDRNEGLDELPSISAGVGDTRPSGDFNQRLGTQDKPAQPKQNFHPTVKPTDLMRYLIKLVTPAGGVVLDPFTGSGSTGKAALLDGYKFIGIELTEEYLPIIEGRLKFACEKAQLESDKLF